MVTCDRDKNSEGEPFGLNFGYCELSGSINCCKKGKGNSKIFGKMLNHNKPSPIHICSKHIFRT